jgi:hypothetical protein
MIFSKGRITFFRFPGRSGKAGNISFNEEKAAGTAGGPYGPLLSNRRMK